MRKGVVFIALLWGTMLTGCAYLPVMPGPVMPSETTEPTTTEEVVPVHNPDDPIEGCYARVASAELSELMVQVDDMVFAPGVTTMNHALDKIDGDGRYTYSVLLDKDNINIEAITIYKNESLYAVIHNTTTDNGNVVGVINPSKDAKSNCWISGGYCLDGSNVGESGTLPMDSVNLNNVAGCSVVLLPTYNGAECVGLTYKILTPAQAN